MLTRSKPPHVTVKMASLTIQYYSGQKETWFPITGPSEAVRHGGDRRTKNLQGEREKRKRRKEGKRKEEKEKREETERKGEESKRERCRPITPI